MPPIGRSGRARTGRGCRRRPACSRPGRRVVCRWSGPRGALAAATAPWPWRANVCSSRAPAAAAASSWPSTAPTARKCGPRRSARRATTTAARAARHADGRRRSALRAHRAGGSREPQDRRHGGLAAQHPAGLRRSADPVADQRVPARRRRARDRVARGRGRRDGEAGQADRENGLGGEGTERRGGLFVTDRRRHAGRAHLHDLHGRRRRRRPRLRRQADVPLPDRGEPDREHHDADLLRQQGVLHLRLRHRGGPARPDRAERVGHLDRRSISRGR